MIRIRQIAVSTAILAGFLALASAQNQQGGPSPSQQGESTPQATSQKPSQQPQGSALQGNMKRGECKQDIEAICPGMHPGDGKWGPCMKQNKDKIDQLPEPCKRRLHHMMHRARERRQERSGGGRGKGQPGDGQAQEGQGEENPQGGPNQGGQKQ